jgi:DNA-directed RNA polymerase specialized sigma24 family protein
MVFQMLEDRILVWRFNHGRPDVVHHIYDKYRCELLTLALALLGDLAVAEDVVQDVFLSLVRLSGRLKLTGSLKGYLATSVANGARNVLRVHRRRSGRGRPGSGRGDETGRGGGPGGATRAVEVGPGPDPV